MSGLKSLVSRTDDGPDRPSVLVVGGNYLGTTLASNLAEEYEVTFLSREPGPVERAARDDVTAHHVDSVDAQAFQRAGADRASVAIAVAEQDSVNLLAAQLLRTTFDVEYVVVRVNHPDRVDSFEDLGVEPVCLSTSVFEAVSERLETAVEEFP